MNGFEVLFYKILLSRTELLNNLTNDQISKTTTLPEFKIFIGKEANEEFDVSFYKYLSISLHNKTLTERHRRSKVRLCNGICIFHK